MAAGVRGRRDVFRGGRRPQRRTSRSVATLASCRSRSRSCRPSRREGDLRARRSCRREPFKSGRKRSAAPPCAWIGSRLGPRRARMGLAITRWGCGSPPKRCATAYSVAGPPAAAAAAVLALDEPVTASLANTANASILTFRLDAAIRALAPAAVADICVSTRARDLLLTLVAAQRRSLLNYKQDYPDHRGSHTLVSARALLTLAGHGEDGAIYEHIDAYADDAALLGTLLRALSAAAEETPARAATGRRIWPHVVRRVLELNDSGHAPFEGQHYGDRAVAALMPNRGTQEFLPIPRDSGQPDRMVGAGRFALRGRGVVAGRGWQTPMCRSVHSLPRRAATRGPGPYRAAVDGTTRAGGSCAHRPAVPICWQLG